MRLAGVACKLDFGIFDLIKVEFEMDYGGIHYKKEEIVQKYDMIIAL